MRSLLAFLAIAACSLGCRDGSSPSNAENRPADEVATATTASASADPGVVEKDCDLVFEAFLGKTPVDLEYPANAEALAAARTKLKGIVELWRDLKPKLQTGPLVAEGNAYAKLVEARIELFTKVRWTPEPGDPAPKGRFGVAGEGEVYPVSLRAELTDNAKAANKARTAIGRWCFAQK